MYDAEIDSGLFAQPVVNIAADNAANKNVLFNIVMVFSLINKSYKILNVNYTVNYTYGSKNNLF
jgi:hypothetical protein